MKEFEYELVSNAMILPTTGFCWEPRDMLSSGASLTHKEYH